MSGDSGESKVEKRSFIGHAVREDPNIDKEDTRPIEKRKKPRVSVRWKLRGEFYGERKK